MANQIVQFFRGQAKDSSGRLLATLQKWPDDQLEDVHDFIQWMFPLRERSGVNPGAPVLEETTIAAFHEDEILRETLRISFLRMLRFYGAEWRDSKVVDAHNFQTQAENWLWPGNHNHLRITRILKCLHTLGLEEDALAFFHWLKSVYERNPGKNLQSELSLLAGSCEIEKMASTSLCIYSFLTTR